MSHKVAIIIYTLYGHIATMAEAIKTGIESAGGKAEIFQVEETLSAEALANLHAPPKPPYPIAKPSTLEDHNIFMFGIPTRFGSMPSQLRALWDHTGRQWKNKSLVGKYAGIFVSSGSQGGGQEETNMSLMSTLVHHGMIFVPWGYTDKNMEKLDEVHGGSPWGAGTLTGDTGQRQPTELELQMATNHGKHFREQVSRVTFKVEARGPIDEGVRA